MATIKLKYVQAFVDRHGTRRFYFRRPGYDRVPLTGLPGSNEFMDAYRKALTGETAPRRKVGAERTAKGSMSALIAEYYQSTEFRSLADVTRSTYRNQLERIRAEHGHKPVDLLEARHIRRILDSFAEAPGTAQNMLKRFRILMRFAVDRGWRHDDPTIFIRQRRSATNGFRTWTDEDIAQFEERWPLGTRAHLALALLLYTAQRRGDVVRMGRQHLRNGQIEMRQQKTGTALIIPIVPALQAALDLVPADQMAFLVTQSGKPFSAAGFTNWFVDCAKEAGLPEHSSPHGLRKAAARRLAEAGRSAHEIMAVTGHRTLSEVSRYTAAADQERLAKGAIHALSRPASATKE